MNEMFNDGEINQVEALREVEIARARYSRELRNLLKAYAAKELKT